ncbi:hypothetical protein [Alteromonas gracilis]|uniref:hypothetical protein n=1 Tax=Alteromonas gracilis TaxID=1479524 RepID=UPI00321AD871
MLRRLILLSSLIIAVPVTAASTIFQASVSAHDEANISEANALHFGTVLNSAGATCNLDSTGTVTGACASSDANVTVGIINISGLVANQPYQVEVVGSDNGVLRFSPAMTIDSIEVLDDDSDQTISTTTTQAGDSTSITVYGNLEVLSELTSGALYQANYTVNVNFQ